MFCCSKRYSKNTYTVLSADYLRTTIRMITCKYNNFGGLPITKNYRSELRELLENVPVYINFIITKNGQGEFSKKTHKTKRNIQSLINILHYEEKCVVYLSEHTHDKYIKFVKKYS